MITQRSQTLHASNISHLSDYDSVTPQQSHVSSAPQIVIPLDGSITLDEMDKTIIQTALDKASYNVTEAARLLGTTRETLRYRIQKYELKTAPAV